MIWRFFYKQQSAAEHGTLYQLQNLLGRTNVTKPKNNFDDCEDFFISVIHSYILVATMLKFKMTSLDETPSDSIVTADAWLYEKSVRKKIIHDLCESVVDSFIKFSFHN